MRERKEGCRTSSIGDTDQWHLSPRRQESMSQGTVSYLRALLSAKSSKMTVKREAIGGVDREGQMTRFQDVEGQLERGK